MKREDHSLVTMMVLGYSCEEVHEWIDECFKDYTLKGCHNSYGNVYYHWIERHHIDAISKKYKIGTVEYNAAKLHVLCDWMSHWGETYIPESREEVKRLLDKFLNISDEMIK